jgi:LacI family transcriptional regulator
MDKNPTRNRTRAVTLQDIADRCGISKIAVSYALRHDRRNVSQATMERVIAMAQEMGYNPALNHAARRLNSNRTGQRVLNYIVALFFPMHLLGFEYFGQMFKGLQRPVKRERYALLTNLGIDAKGWEDEIDIPLPLAFPRGDVDGIIIRSQQGSARELLKRLRAEMPNPVPVVTLNEPTPGCSAVLANDFEGGYAAATHLLGLGHRHIACFKLEERNYPHTQRFKGYLQAYAEHNLDPAIYLHPIECDTDDHSEVSQQVLALLEACPEITAILSVHDCVATLLYRLLHQRGMRIPQDISLVGFDDAEPFTDASGTSLLTTVYAPLEEIGEKASELLIRRITGEAKRDETIVLPTKLMVRATTAPPLR